jgi:hypothetical protein
MLVMFYNPPVTNRNHATNATANSAFVQDNGNAKSYLQAIKNNIMENLRSIVHAPSVQMHEVPPDSYIPEVDQDDLTSPDERIGRECWKRKIPLLFFFFDASLLCFAL